MYEIRRSGFFCVHCSSVPLLPDVLKFHLPGIKMREREKKNREKMRRKNNKNVCEIECFHKVSMKLETCAVGMKTTKFENKTEMPWLNIFNSGAKARCCLLFALMSMTTNA